MSNREWNLNSPVSDHVWAQAIQAVVERRLSLRQASQTFGLQEAALQRLVRQQTLQRLRRPAPTRSVSGSGTSLSNSEDGGFTVPASSAMGSSGRYVFPRLNPLALGRSSPNGGPLPAVASVMTPSAGHELTPELNDVVVTWLREKYLQQQKYDDYEISDGQYARLEGYSDADIADVVRIVARHNGHRSLPQGFPSANWLTMFKRENDFVDVDDMVRSRSRTSSGNTSVKSAIPSQFQQQERFNHNYEIEQQQFELEAHHRRGGGWIQNRNYRQPPAPPPTSPLQDNCHASYVWESGSEDGLAPQQQQRLRYFHQRHPRYDSRNFRRSPSAGSSNGRSSHSGHADSSASDRHYRQSNLVPAKVWEAAMEDVAIHGMSLRNAAKAHGVHFAALHRRLKKRQQHKLNMPCEPNYIPFEDEAGVVRVIHARAEMGVMLTFTELVDLLKRTALKHRSDLPEDIAAALVRRFQSRVEQSVRHLIIGWPEVPSNVLYRLRDTSYSQDDKDVSVPTNAGATSIISRSSGETGSLSSSGSSSSLSPHPQAAVAVPAPRKFPAAAATAPVPTWNNEGSIPSNTNNIAAGGTDDNNDNGEGTSATAMPSPDDNEATAVILRL
ncbi:hypothetical protein P3T76_013971 [Phytophthora citrophthora]|uniref:HTH psq-type domain-containing protein n=1 Tax=Phytophthora citrophthora TaxID=4793 RepID=A0AAD9LBR6_9STRA|nr:hypothetical protein P3T76_013971 [Phytophthora citrophthora]